MYKKEIKFIQAIQENNYEDALTVFDSIFAEGMQLCDEDMRCIKNQLITLNAMLYKSYLENDDKLEEAFGKRKYLNHSFEDARNESELKRVGFDMIDHYIDLYNDNTPKTSNHAVNQALVFMNRHLHENLTLGVVADKIHMSKSYLSSLFAKHMKSSFPELMTEMRVRTAKNLLKNTNISILSVSYRCGYNSQSYFCSTFKKQTGYTPSDYRDNKIEE